MGNEIDPVLVAALSEVVQKQTFSLEAVKNITDLKDKVSDLERQLALQSKATQSAVDRAAVLDARHSALLVEKQALERSLAEIKSREDRMTSCELRAAVAEAKSETVMQCFSLVFRNTVVRNELTGQVARQRDSEIYQPSGNGYSNTKYQSDTVPVSETKTQVAE